MNASSTPVRYGHTLPEVEGLPVQASRGERMPRHIHLPPIPAKRLTNVGGSR